MNARFNRRRFLVTTSTSAGLLILGHGTSARGYVANEKLDIAAVGAGGRGAANLADLESENIVALCDVDERRAAPAFAKYASAKKYHDYRLLFHEMASEIDAVVVSAPNHVHVPASVTAMYLDKHVYCEKPLAHSMHEARWAARVAAEKRLATQMGTQIHATENYRRIVELVQAGAIGTVNECHCWLKGGGSAGDRPVETPPVPPELHWDLWLATAPFRPFHPCYVPHDWHYWWDFGGGEFGNMGCHYFDLMFWALDLRHPVSIEATGPAAHAESTPAWQHVRYQFPMRGDRPAVTLTWTHGREAPEVFARNNVPDWAWGVLVGEKGLLAVDYNQRMLLPQAAFADYQPPAPSIPPSAGHHREWIAACKTGSPTLCNFDYSGAVTEAVLLGNIAYRTGEKLEWDADAFRITNVPSANDYLRREYRKDWEVTVTG